MNQRKQIRSFEDLLVWQMACLIPKLSKGRVLPFSPVYPFAFSPVSSRPANNKYE